MVSAFNLQDSPAAAAPSVRCVPVLRLLMATLLLDADSDCDVQERRVAAIQLSFDYDSIRLRVSDEQEGFFVAAGSNLAQVSRNRKTEREAQRVLESFGAVELSCLSNIGDVDADYLVSVSDNIHALCSFTAYALPQLRKLGWRVLIDTDYPYRTIDANTTWYAAVEEDPTTSDWFSLELGVEVDGDRVNLLPGLLEILNASADSESLTSILRTPARFRAVPIGENRYAVIPPERLQRLLHILEALYSEEGDGVRFNRNDVAPLAALDEVFMPEGDNGQQRLVWDDASEVIAKGRALVRSPRLPEVRVASSLQATLREYQQEGLNWLQHLRASDAGGVLADDMGLGKTLQTISHLATEKESGRMDLPSIIIVPTSLVGNWVRETKRFAPFLRVVAVQGAKRHELYERLHRAHLIVTTYPVLVRDLERFRDMKFHLIVLDEAQAIKNSRSLANSAVSLLQGRHKLCLTGTPVENNLSELWSLFDFLMPGFLGDRAYFKSRYQTPIERDKNETRLIQLRERVAPYILRRMKHTVAKDLPPKTELVRPVDISGDQRDLYESIRMAAHSQVRRVIKTKGLAGSTITILDALMKLRQVCCDPRLVTSEAARNVKESAKYTFLMEMLETQLANQHRVLIFSQFTQMLGLIATGLRERDMPFITLTGATQDRQARCDEFENGRADIFLISLKAGGTGLNLTSADTVVHFDPWWNPAAQAQATDRAYRIGQKRPVFVYNLIVAGSVEERMLRLQSQKRHLAETILGTGGAAPQPLSEDDVEDLFQPLDAGSATAL
jgi:superfamily II DNA or RNA helicase